jgi:hypothetical protein
MRMSVNWTMPGSGFGVQTAEELVRRVFVPVISVVPDVIVNVASKESTAPPVIV